MKVRTKNGPTLAIVREVEKNISKSKEIFKFMEERNNAGSMQDVSDMKLKCADCGKEIKELPFRPEEGREIRCPDCFKKKRDDEREARMIDVSDKDIKCAGCGKKIEKLPFEPSGDRPVYCRDCYRK